MSIFDQFDKSLPGDSGRRKVLLDEEYQTFDSAETLIDLSKRAMSGFYFVAILVFICLIVQLLNLQISHGSFNRVLAEGNRLRQREIASPRGLIYDTKGKLIVGNDAAFNLQLYPQDLPGSKKDRQDFFNELSQIVQISPEEIEAKIQDKGANRADPVILKENIDRDTALLLETKLIYTPGVVIAKKPIRRYEEIPGLAQVIGYVGKITDTELKSNRNYRMNQEMGKDGIEKQYQAYLQGVPGINQIEVDSRGRAQRLLSNRSPEPGNNLTLSIDADLETELTMVMNDQVEASGVKSGAAVAINPKTGEILAMTSVPTYDNNLFAKGVSGEDYQKIITDSANPLLNRAIAGAYPSGSIIKPLVASAGLQENVIGEHTTINDTGEIRVGSWVYPDWKAHGLVDVRKSLAVSANVFFYAIGGGFDKIKGIGVDKLKYYYEQFGLGKPTGIDIPGEVSGLVPDAAWKEKAKKEAWYLGDTYHMSIGQGDVLVTPLQMAVTTAAIANNGEVLEPFLVKKITDKDGKTVVQSEKHVVRKDFISQDNLSIVQGGMRDCVTQSYGSCRALNELPVAVAAKTGTAQFGIEGKTHAWMSAFAPYNDPQIAIVVLVEGGGEGYAAAGPVINRVFNWYFSK